MKFRRDAPRILIGATVLVVVAASIISSLLFTNMKMAGMDGLAATKQIMSASRKQES